MTERLVIDHLAHRGDGVANTPSGPLFVTYALPGETVEVEALPGHPDRRNLLRVETPSPERIEPFCPHFGVCGGCAIQHWTPARYREWKRGLVVAVELLERLDLREVGRGQADLDAVGFSVGDLAGQHGGQVLLVRPALGAGLGGQFGPDPADQGGS